MGRTGMEQGYQDNKQMEEVRAYVKKHKLNELFSIFLQLLVYYKPEDPRAFLQREVKLMLEGPKPTPLFEEKDLETMFYLIDVTKQQWVTLDQLRNTCRNLATAAGGGKVALSPEHEQAIDRAADENGLVNIDKFKEVLSMQLLSADVWTTYEEQTEQKS
ncbi:uncharacterized protein TM35_000023690 [Trypanosoma theileri]|uniref:EF-hand domain-containing protein n=1 Tax=Trypanosoma theileri TaxID=67003 RepID=A0A1X0P8S8_9TRYP|nr:uncharacterized protein TM35_000023690 [Trypanosoma theileri]ORC93043.1 hypothetical protein TM35_000023690 [Trypanosoma theileri]